jgi:hypothetical protein
MIASIWQALHRFDLPEVQLYDYMGPYRPNTLRTHVDFAKYYEQGAPFPATSAQDATADAEAPGSHKKALLAYETAIMLSKPDNPFRALRPSGRASAGLSRRKRVLEGWAGTPEVRFRKPESKEKRWDNVKNSHWNPMEPKRRVGHDKQLMLRV